MITGNIYRVGERFPHEAYLDCGEITVAMMNEQFFDILVIMNGISETEKKAFRKGKLIAGLFEYKYVPFVVIESECFNFDVSVDITKITDEQQETWLNSDTNALQLFLVDADTGNIEAMRLLGISFAEEIRDILEVQTELTTQDVVSRISEAMIKIDTDYMLRNAKKKQVFK